MESLKPFVEQLKHRVSIVDIVGRSVPLKPKGKQWWGCCPFHNEKTPSFSVNEEMGIFKCFGCGEGGDVITFLMKRQNMQYMDALRELAGIAGVKMPDFKPRDPEEEKREASYFELMAKASEVFEAALPGSAAEEYLTKRGFTSDTIKKYKLGYAPKGNILAGRFGAAMIPTGMTRHSQTPGGGDYDFFRNRLMFPIINVRGNVVAFSGRSLDGSEPKYINIAETEFFQKRRTLCGLHLALPEIRNKGRVIVVEGQIDSIQMQFNGFGETVAPLGTALTIEHIQILQKYAKELIFCYDGDLAGQKAAGRTAALLMPTLKSDMVIKFVTLPDGKDPDDILRLDGGAEKLSKIMDDAPLLPEYMWALANKNFLVKTENGRTQASKWIRAEYEKIPDILLKNEYLLTLKNREFGEWNKYRHTIKPEMQAPDPTMRQARLVSEIAAKFGDIYEANFELLGMVDTTDAPDTKMTRDAAVKIVKDIALNKQLQSMIAENAAADEIQRIKDAILDLWN